MAPTPEGVRGEAARAIRGTGHGGSFFTQAEDHLTTEAMRSSTEHDLPHPGLAKQRIQADRCTPVIFQERRVAVDAHIGLPRKRFVTSFQATPADPSHADVSFAGYHDPLAWAGRSDPADVALSYFGGNSFEPTIVRFMPI